MISKCLQDKIMFVENLDEAMEGYIPNVDGVAYEVFENKKRGWTDEFVVVYYKGGAIQARNCNMNSNSSIFREISNMLNNSQLYPQDTARYKEMLSDFNTYNSYGAGSLI